MKECRIETNTGKELITGDARKVRLDSQCYKGKVRCETAAAGWLKSLREILLRIKTRELKVCKDATGPGWLGRFFPSS